MKLTSFLSLCIVTLIACVANASDGSASGQETTLVDMFSGSFSVPINFGLPPARAGLTPQIALQYHNAAPNGAAGVGWTFTIPRIERQTRGGVDYSDLYLEMRVGPAVQDLVQTGDGLFEEKIVRQHLKLTISWATGGFVAVGPTGVKLFFGSSSNSRLAADDSSRVFAWGLDRAEDRWGNFYTIAYHRTGQSSELLPSRVDYNGGTGIAPNLAVVFSYETRSDAVVSHTPGFESTQTERLSTVKIVANQTTQTLYTLSYTASPVSSRSLLGSVIQTDKSGNALPPTTFSYTDSNLSAPLPISGPGAVGDSTQCVPLDVDGDARLDISCYAGSGNWDIWLGRAEGLQKSSWKGVNPGSSVTECVRLDVNHDGRIDLACYSGSSDKWNVSISTGTTFQTLVWAGGPVPSGLSAAKSCTSVLMGPSGDQGILCYTGTDRSGRGQYSASVASASGFATSSFGGPALTLPLAQNCVFADFDADLYSDMVCMTSGTNGRIDFSRISTNGWTTTSYTGNLSWASSQNCLAGRFSDDSMPELLCKADGNNPPYLVSFAGSHISPKPLSGSESFAVGPISCLPIDPYQRRHDGIACSQGNGTWKVLYVTGDSVDVTTVSGWPSPGPPVTYIQAGVKLTAGLISGKCISGDIAGSGFNSLICGQGSGSQIVAFPARVPADLLYRVDTGMGAWSSVNYTPAAESTNLSLPVPVMTVSTFFVTDGRSSPVRTDYHYAGGLYVLSEQSFRGFAQVIATSPKADDGKRLVRTTYFHQGNDTSDTNSVPNAPDGFMAGNPYWEYLADSDGQILSFTRTIYTAAGDTAPWFSPVAMVETLTCSDGTCPLSNSAVYTYDSWGNTIHEKRTSTTNGVSKVTTIERTYVVNSSAGITSLPASETTYADTATTPFRKREFYYDGASACDVPSTSQQPTFGGLTRVVIWTGVSDHFETRSAFDAHGNVICRRDALGATTSLIFDPSASFATSAIDEGLSRTIEYSGINGSGAGLYGQVTRTIDPNGVVHDITYDGFGRQIKSSTPDGVTTTAYVDFGIPDTQHQHTVSPSGLVTDEYLDGLGRTVRKDQTGPDGVLWSTDIIYGDGGSVYATSRPHPLGTPPSQWTVTIRDVLQRATGILTAQGTQTLFCYGAGVTVSIDENGSRRRESFNADGKLQSVDEYLGRFSTCTVDRLVPANVSLESLAASSSQTIAPYSTTFTEYAPNGQVSRVTDPAGNVSEWQYDLADRVTHTSDPNSGSKDYFYAGAVLDHVIDAMGRSIYYTRQKDGRLIQKDFGSAKATGQGDVRFELDAGSYGKGRVSAISNAISRTAFTFDSAGRRIGTSRTIGGKTYSSLATFDSEGRQNSLTFPDGYKVFYEYSGPSLVRIFDGNRTIVTYSDFTPEGMPRKVIYGNGIVTTLQYSGDAIQPCAPAFDRVCVLLARDSSGRALIDLGYFYSKSNVMRLQTDFLAGKSTVYSTDALLRLNAVGNFPATTIDIDHVQSSIDAVGGLAPTQREQQLQTAYPDAAWTVLDYDVAGNIRYKTGIGIFAYPVSGLQSRLPHAVGNAGPTSVLYNSAGQGVLYGDKEIDYDSEGLVSSVTSSTAGSVQFDRDAMGEIIAIRPAAGPEKFLIGDLSECTDSGCVDYVLLHGHRIAEHQGSSFTWYHSDEMNSVIAISDENGAVRRRLSYGPFGEMAPVAGDPDKLYLGSQFDPVSGCYLLGPRLYCPPLGRFLQPDPQVGSNAVGQSLNRYSYAWNSPLFLNDPSGRFPFISAIIGAIVGAIEGVINHENIWKSALEGAIRFSLFDLADGLLNVAFPSAAIFDHAVAGGLSGLGTGLSGAAIFHTNPFPDALYGTGLGVIGSYSEGLNLGGVSNVGWAEGNARYVLNNVFRQSLLSGALAGASGRPIGPALLRGAEFGGLSAGFNMALGHAVGVISTLVYQGDGPQWNSQYGAFVYQSNCKCGALTVGNVMSFDVYNKTLIGPDSATPIIQHESGHIPQSYDLGVFYLPAHVLSYVGGEIYSMTGLGSPDGHGIPQYHQFSLLENAWQHFPSENRINDLFFGPIQ